MGVAFLAPERVRVEVPSAQRVRMEAGRFGNWKFREGTREPTRLPLVRDQQSLREQPKIPADGAGLLMEVPRHPTTIALRSLFSR